MINFELLRALKDKGLRQNEFARLVHEDPATVSRVINSILMPKPQRRRKYAHVLGKTVDELWPKR